jgi:hypothetical protein
MLKFLANFDLASVSFIEVFGLAARNLSEASRRGSRRPEWSDQENV